MRKFKKEFRKNIKYGILAIGIVLIVMAGFYFHAVQTDFEKECGFCKTTDCMDNNGVCGDFGIYYFKFFSLVTMGMFGTMGILSRGWGDGNNER
jgi:hypothetical protein